MMTQRDSAISIALDILRGIAALYMVIHHLWARFGIKLSLPAEVLVFLGSCAPVVFFFVTGVGMGLAPQRTGPLSPWTWRKVIVLATADQMMAWMAGRIFGLDFLGFIALSSLVLEGVARMRRPMRSALILATAIVLLRFIIGASVVLPNFGPASDAIGYVVGALPVPGISYPPLPWLVYPLFGFAVGRAFVARQTREAQLVAFGVVIIAAGATIALALRDAIVFRWSTMSVAFFTRSLLVLAGSALVAMAIAQTQNLARLVSLRGIASFALVPIHYFIIAVLAAALSFRGQVPPSEAALLVWLGLLAPLAFVLSNTFARRTERVPVASIASLTLVDIAALAIAFACGVALLVLLPGYLPATALMATGQLSLCILLRKAR